MNRRERGRRWEDAQMEGEEVHSPATVSIAQESPAQFL